MNRPRKRQIKNQPMRKVMITVDTITDAVVKALQEREGLSFSGALCALATSAALKDPALQKVIYGVVQAATAERLASRGWHPDLSKALAHQLVEGTEETLSWS